MPSTAFNFRTSCYSLVGVDTSRKWPEGRLIGIALRSWVLLEVLGIFFFCLFEEVQYFEGHYSMGQVLESFANQVGMNNPQNLLFFLGLRGTESYLCTVPVF